MDPYLNIFDEPVRYKRHRRRAGYSSATVVVMLALVVIVLLIWWQASVPESDDLIVDYNRGMLLDQEGLTQLPGPTSTVGGLNDATSEAQMAAVRARTRAELNAIQARLEAEQDYDAALQSIENLEADLERSYAQSTGEASAQWNEIKADFDVIEDRLRQGSADSLSLFAELLQRLEADVRVNDVEQSTQMPD